MADKAKHAFGALERVDSALTQGAIDSFDILFVKDENGKPYVGWIDKDGKKVIVDDSKELAELESKLAAKVSAEEVDAKLETKADAVEVTKLEEEVSKKVDATVVQEMIEEHSSAVIEVVEF